MKSSTFVRVMVWVLVITGGGRCAGGTILRVGPGVDDFPSIQAALNSAGDGDAIAVAAGTYYEAIDFLGKAVHLVSRDGPAATIINADGLNTSVVSCHSGEGPGTVLEGFTLTGGNSTSGGGMVNSYSSPTVKNCIFTGNVAFDSGGGMANTGSNPTVINSIFIDNATETFGGGLFNTGSSAPTLINCTVTRNSGLFGSGIVNWDNSHLSLENCIVWGNVPFGSPQLHDESGSITTAGNSNIQGGHPGIGNIDANPLFVHAAGGNLRLSEGSPCIDTGNNAAVPEGITTDLDGILRIIDGTGGGHAVVDMGAYEYLREAIQNTSNGTYYPTIQSAINDADAGNEIKVQPGTYHEAIDFLGKAVRLVSSDGPAVTILDGTGHYHVVQCVSGEGADTILEGFTITGGNANGPTTADRDGGGMYNRNSSPTVIGCVFTGNIARLNGGGMCNWISRPTVTGCTFMNNDAPYGGGMYNRFDSPVITDCAFIGNTAQEGGGMYNYGVSPTVTGCIFIENVGGNGGGIYNWAGGLTLTNSTFIGNYANSFAGGGMFNGGGNNAVITNCTFSGNATIKFGGGMYNRDSNPTLTNTILWGNGAEQIYDENSSPTVTYSTIQGGYSGTGNIDTDPAFADTAAGNLRLLFGSPCIDTGTNAAVPAGIVTDLDGNGRMIDGNGDGAAVVDMGAYEFDATAFPLNVTKKQFYPTIQAAIDDAADADQIEVSPGTYHESINFIGKAIRLYSTGGPAVTILDGTGHYHVVQCITGEDPNTILEGFTLTGGNANGPTDPDQRGGGMRIYLSSPTVIGCLFKNNVSDGLGGGLYIESGSPAPTVTDCIFDGNSAIDGGGMYNRNSSPTVIDCLFKNNATSQNGGGMYNFQSCPAVSYCSFISNTATGTGGGMYSREYSHYTITHSTFSGNYASGGGGAMVHTFYTRPKLIHCLFNANMTDARGGAIWNYYYSNATLTHCTFSQNSARDGGGILNSGPSHPTVVNSILWGNSPNQLLNIDTSNPTVTYSTIQGDSLWPGEGNINADPLFVAAATGNLRLRPGSPCIDAGDNAAVPAGVTTDLNGWSRFIDDLCTADTGRGTAPLADMGPYEFLPADVDASGGVNWTDFGVLAAHWQQAGAGAAGADINCDNVVDLADVAMLLTWWLEGGQG